MTTQPNLDSTLIWHKSRASGGSGQCVEVTTSGSSVLVRDSGDGTDTILTFTHAQWLGLLQRIRDGAEFAAGSPRVRRRPPSP